MKPGLHWFTIFIAVVGLVAGALNIGYAAMHPPADELQEIVRLLRYTVGAAQIAPLTGFWLGREVLSGSSTGAWTMRRRSGWILWMVVALPLSLLGVLSALTIFLF